jgi:hypothetical protein
MFGTIKSLIPEPRQADQPRNYVGRHRQPESASARATVPNAAPLAATAPTPGNVNQLPGEASTVPLRPSIPVVPGPSGSPVSEAHAERSIIEEN